MSYDIESYKIEGLKEKNYGVVILISEAYETRDGRLPNEGLWSLNI
jgi:hypothetical protein